MKLLDFPPSTKQNELVRRVQLHLTPAEKALHLQFMLHQKQELMLRLRLRMRELRSQLGLLRREAALRARNNGTLPPA